jgi:hypothetical protein
VYTDDSAPVAGNNWQVEPEQVQAFAAAVEQVRADLAKISSEVAEMSTPNYAPLLGTSPVGQELADKFTDRMGSEQGLHGQLTAAITRMEEFIASAERSAAQYQTVDGDNSSKFKFV